MKNSLIRITAIVLGLFGLVSCDKDFNSTGSDLFDDHFDLKLKEDVTVVAYTKPTGAVQSNNLPVNALGIYNNPVFGKTKANFVTQVELPSTITIGTNVDIKSNDSVYLYVPYFSTLDDTDADGNNIYILDSIYGNQESSINLKIFESKYILRDYNPTPNPEDISTYYQKYYSDEKNLIEGNLGNQLNTSSNTVENTQFKFKDDEIIIYQTDENGNFIDNNGHIVTDVADRVVDERIKPGMWINLDKQFFEDLFIESSSASFLNNAIFKEKLKGIYFQVEENISQDGVMAMLDFKSAYIMVQFHSDVTTTTSSGSTTTNAKREVKLSLTGNTINFVESTNSSIYQAGLNTSNEATGDEKLYLKGGNGSVAYIDLFGADTDGDGVPQELEMLRNNGWLINEANLVFYIDKNTVTGMGQSGIVEPRRIYLYDATNNTTLLDYLDAGTSSDIKLNKATFGGIMEFEDIEEEENERGTLYRIRITNYINKIIKGDDNGEYGDNVRLGLSVTENINISTNSYLKSPITVGSQQIKFIPTGGVMNPLGTILYGNNVAPADEAKKLKLQIFYTKPN